VSIGTTLAAARETAGLSLEDVAAASLIYERLMAPPERLYGLGIGSSYQSQGLALSKHFRL